MIKSVKCKVQSVKCNGYTLVELLIVIAIISILGVVVFINARTFAQDQVLNRSLGEVQSALRLAQTNATSGLVCIDSENVAQGGVWWSVQFSDKTKALIYCEKSNQSQKTFQLDNVEIVSIKGSSCAQDASLPVTVTYSALYGVLTFSALDPCIGTSNTLTFTFKNLKNGNVKGFNLSKGGAIDVQ